MALVNCPECNQEVSSEAMNCPKCGFPLHKGENREQIHKFLLTFARKDNSLRINRLVGLLENWVTR